jgi:hypothetical protein
MNNEIPNIQKRIIGKQRMLYHLDANALRQKREAWGAFEQRGHDVFDKLINEFNEESFFGNLFIEPEGSSLIEKKHQNTLCVRFGLRTTGIVRIEYNLDGSMKSGKSNIEEGGALLFSQSPNGRVACIIFGSKSDLLKPKDEYFIYKFYDSPSLISTWQIMKAVNAFFWYARITSHINGFSIWNTFKLDFYKIRSFTHKPDWNSVFGVIGALAALASIITFIKG